MASIPVPVRRRLTWRWLVRGLTLLLAAGIASWLFLPVSPRLTERLYSTGIYLQIARVLIPITSAVPVSMTGALLIMLPVVLVVSMVRSWRHYRQTRLEQTGLEQTGRKRITLLTWLLMWLERLITSLVIIAGLFLLTWGLNYNRLAVEDVLGLSDYQASQDDLQALSEYLLGVIQETYPHAGSRTPGELDAALQAGRLSLQTVIWELSQQHVTLPQRPKYMLPGFLIISGNAVGVISPWLLEAHVDSALPAPYSLVVSLHEFVHLAGYAGEADADFLAALAGLRADNPLMRYSSALRLFGQLAWRLPQASYRELYEQLPAQALTDMDERRAISTRYRMPRWFERTQVRVYDSYLRSQGVEAGVADYGRMVNWLAQAHARDMLTDSLRLPESF
ncbi:MAG: DUF3810 family protein [Deinococcota bacterium]